MKYFSKRTLMLLTALLAAIALTVVAKPAPSADFFTSVAAKAAQSEKGVIVVLTERGAVAAEAAYLLMTQVEQNSGFAPLLMAPEPDELKGYMSALSLSRESLPAVIFYSKEGKELGRVVAVKLTSVRLSQFHTS
jgi:hypothetical protein